MILSILAYLLMSEHTYTSGQLPAGWQQVVNPYCSDAPGYLTQSHLQL
jgi:hypothetical protein